MYLIQPTEEALRGDTGRPALLGLQGFGGSGGTAGVSTVVCTGIAFGGSNEAGVSGTGTGMFTETGVSLLDLTVSVSGPQDDAIKFSDPAFKEAGDEGRLLGTFVSRCDGSPKSITLGVRTGTGAGIS